MFFLQPPINKHNWGVQALLMASLRTPPLCRSQRKMLPLLRSSGWQKLLLWASWAFNGAWCAVFFGFSASSYLMHLVNFARFWGGKSSMHLASLCSCNGWEHWMVIIDSQEHDHERPCLHVIAVAPHAEAWDEVRKSAHLHILGDVGSGHLRSPNPQPPHVEGDVVREPIWIKKKSRCNAA